VPSFAQQSDRPTIRRFLALLACVASFSLAGFPAEAADAPLVALPENAYRTNSAISPKWECSWGFRAKDAACERIDVPDNGYLIDGGTGWDCTRGFQRSSGKCLQIIVPEHAYLVATGYDAWECEHGYRKEGQSCAQVLVPANGYLSDTRYYGPGWKCDRGYRAVSGACAAIVVPKHGYLTDTEPDRGWSCERGYRAKNDACVAIVPPSNARLADSAFGRGWECDRGFKAVAAPCDTNEERKVLDAADDTASACDRSSSFERQICARIDLPENSYLDDSGQNWRCARGFARNAADQCDAILIPANAHLSRAGNGWECDRPFKQDKDACVMR
jgi:hypothetical protein